VNCREPYGSKSTITGLAQGSWIAVISMLTKNLVVACRSCNVLKGSMPFNRFLAELESLRASVSANRKTAG